MNWWARRSRNAPSNRRLISLDLNRLSILISHFIIQKVRKQSDKRLSRMNRNMRGNHQRTTILLKNLPTDILKNRNYSPNNLHDSLSPSTLKSLRTIKINMRTTLKRTLKRSNLLLEMTFVSHSSTWSTMMTINRTTSMKNLLKRRKYCEITLLRSSHLKINKKCLKDKKMRMRSSLSCS